MTCMMPKQLKCRCQSTPAVDNCQSLSNFMLSRQAPLPFPNYRLIKRDSCSCLADLARAPQLYQRDYEHDDDLMYLFERSKSFSVIMEPAKQNKSNCVHDEPGGWGQFVDTDAETELCHISVGVIRTHRKKVISGRAAWRSGFSAVYMKVLITRNITLVFPFRRTLFVAACLCCPDFCTRSASTAIYSN